MQSEMHKRQTAAERFADARVALEAQAAEAEITIQDYKLAEEALREVPRKLTNCRLELHRFNVSLVVERGTCSMCGEVTMGWEAKWRWCPACGSRITEAVKESDPRERLQREAVNSAVNQLQGVR
jgi:hypothetical protein